MPTSPYQMAINNTARFIQSPKNRDTGSEDPTINAFDASIILAIAFCKNKEEVLADLLRAKV